MQTETRRHRSTLFSTDQIELLTFSHSSFDKQTSLANYVYFTHSEPKVKRKVS